jgi:hypothetical protein
MHLHMMRGSGQWASCSALSFNCHLAILFTVHSARGPIRASSDTRDPHRELRHPRSPRSPDPEFRHPREFRLPRDPEFGLPGVQTPEFRHPREFRLPRDPEFGLPGVQTPEFRHPGVQTPEFTRPRSPRSPDRGEAGGIQTPRNSDTHDPRGIQTPSNSVTHDPRDPRETRRIKVATHGWSFSIRFLTRRVDLVLLSITVIADMVSFVNARRCRRSLTDAHIRPAPGRR